MPCLEKCAAASPRATTSPRPPKSRRNPQTARPASTAATAAATASHQPCAHVVTAVSTAAGTPISASMRTSQRRSDVGIPLVLSFFCTTRPSATPNTPRSSSHHGATSRPARRNAAMRPMKLPTARTAAARNPRSQPSVGGPNQNSPSPVRWRSRRPSDASTAAGGSTPRSTSWATTPFVIEPPDTEDTDEMSRPQAGIAQRQNRPCTPCGRAMASAGHGHPDAHGRQTYCGRHRPRRCRPRGGFVGGRRGVRVPAVAGERGQEHGGDEGADDAEQPAAGG